MEDLSISVALCTYNGARHLPDQLESIAAQTKLPDELIICDDGSTDETANIIEEFAKHVPFPVKFEVNEQNLGSTKNFERAISTCSGDVIALADQDDIWEIRKLEVLARTLNQQPEMGYVFSDAELIDADAAPIGRGLWETFGFTSVLSQFTPEAQVRALLRRSLVTGATMAFRSRLKTAILPISPYFVHDSWIVLAASCVGEYGIPLPERLIRYRQHGAQQMGTRQQSIWERVAMVRKANEDQCGRAKLGMSDLRDRLWSLVSQGMRIDESVIDIVEQKLEHCSRRLDAHGQRGTARMRGVLAEILTGRYPRFSNSWRSVILDLLF